MSTYKNLQDRIANELNKTGLTSEIQLAIKSAIEFYGKNRFPWNVQTKTTTTTAGVEWLDVPDDFIDDIDLILIDGTDRNALEKMPDGWITRVEGSTDDTGEPRYYAIYGGNIRLLPVPDAEYTLKLRYVYRHTELSADDDSNMWTQYDKAEALIRLHAKWDLCLNVIRSEEAKRDASGYLQAAGMQLGMLMDQVRAQEATGRMMPYGF